MFNILVHQSRIPKAYGLLQEKSLCNSLYAKTHVNRSNQNKMNFREYNTRIENNKVFSSP